jgi:uncharacterized protein
MKKLKTRKNILFLIIMSLLVSLATFAQQGGSSSKEVYEKNKRTMNILIHLTQGPENPTRAALAFLVARTAIEEGHTVNMFLAGDAVQLIRNGVLESLTGLGTGKLKEHFDIIIKGGGKIYLSGMSAQGRGVSNDDLKDKAAEFAMPKKLVELSIESDRMFTY